MKNTYFSVLALALATASLSSCSRSNYAFNPTAPAYLGTTTSRNVAKASVVAAPAAAEVPVATPAASAPVMASAPVAAPAVAQVAVVPVAASALVAARPAPTPAAAPAPVATEVATAPALATTATPIAKPSLVQKIMLNKVLKRLNKAEARQQNTASTTHTTAKASAYLGLAALGLVLLIIGIIASAGWLTTIGAIAIVVGLIIFIFNNI